MHTYLRKLPLAAALVAAAALGLPAVADADTHVWNYKSYKKGTSGTFDRSRFVAGTLTLQEEGGQATITITAGTLDACLAGALPATVTRTDTQTVIEVPPHISGCEHFRYVIRNDGSGGVREGRRGERWFTYTYDFDLTPKK
ncbi:MAG: hypothetical protein OZ923_01580 [Comamonadaceae bacterium]|nr:hypothetical protein [Burkholderiales bacterium]MEB2347288.1 hypothetical protein [Comamonadaceae bacterium]